MTTKDRDDSSKARPFLAAMAVILTICGVILVTGCSSPGSTDGDNPASREGFSWNTMALTDIGTGSQFDIAGFSGKPVLLHTFTVSCPVCTRQQQEIKKVQGEGEVSFISVGLDIDPNEDPKALAEHIRQNGFDGYYALSPLPVTQSLFDEFGGEIITPATAPLILICPDGRARMFEPGIKPAAVLKQALLSEC